MWNITLDGLIEGITANHPSLLTQAFADDLSILQKGICYSTIAYRINQGLAYTQDWCKRAGLKINPSKTDLILFGYRKKAQLPQFSFQGTIIPRKTEVKYLGVVIDNKLTWTAHCRERYKKAAAAMAVLRRFIGPRWGLSPRITLWLYTTMIRPIIDYGAIV